MQVIDTFIKNNDIQEAINKARQEGLISLSEIIGKVSQISPITVIKPYCNWISSEELCKVWNKMSQDGKGKWKNIQLDWKSSNPDYYVVVNSLPIGVSIDSPNIIYFRMEPHMEKHPEMWGAWSNPNPKQFYWYGGHEAQLNNVEWHLSKTYKQLLNHTPKKEEKLDDRVSTVLSHKYVDPGHIKRVDFVKFLEGKEDLWVDVFGSESGNKIFKYIHYKGSLPVYTKDKALFPYKYTFNVENNDIYNYCTEKLYDGILAECLTFYWGCPNISKYIDPRAYVVLDLNNFEKSYDTIKRAIREDWWSQRIGYIRQAKQNILQSLQFFPRLHSIVNKTN